MLTIFTEDLTNPYKEGDSTITFHDRKFHYMGEEADVKTFNGTEYKVLNFKRDYSWKEMILPRIKLLSLAILTLGFLFISPKFRKNFTATFAKEEKLQLNILNPKTEIQPHEILGLLLNSPAPEKTCEKIFKNISMELHKGHISNAKALLDPLKIYVTNSTCSPTIRNEYNIWKIMALKLEIKQQDAKLDQLQDKVKTQTKKLTSSENNIETLETKPCSEVVKKPLGIANSVFDETLKEIKDKDNAAINALILFYEQLNEARKAHLSQLEIQIAAVENITS